MHGSGARSSQFCRLLIVCWLGLVSGEATLSKLSGRVQSQSNTHMQSDEVNSGIPRPNAMVEDHEGTSLRKLVFTTDVHVPDELDWSIFYDEETGHPYYFNTVSMQHVFWFLMP